MFLEKKFILANELVKKMKIHIANISMLRNTYSSSEDIYTIKKLNNCTFINTASEKLPNNILQGIKKHGDELTDMSDKLPCTYIRSEYGMTEKELMKSGIVIKKVKVASKDFYVFNPEFVKTMKNKIGYVLNAGETKYCSEHGEIEGSIKLSKNKFFTWY